jgi:Flp pilus assembly protein TadD
MRALYGLGYTLVEAGRPSEDLRRAATPKLTPYNAWAWCWLGRACAELGGRDEARIAFV